MKVDLLPDSATYSEDEIVAYHDEWRARLRATYDRVEKSGERPLYNSDDWWACLTQQKLQHLDSLLLPRRVSNIDVSDKQERDKGAGGSDDSEAETDTASPRLPSEPESVSADEQSDDAAGNLRCTSDDDCRPRVDSQDSSTSRHIAAIVCGRLSGSMTVEQAASAWQTTQGRGADVVYAKELWAAARSSLPYSATRGTLQDDIETSFASVSNDDWRASRARLVSHFQHINKMDVAEGVSESDCEGELGYAALCTQASDPPLAVHRAHNVAPV